MKDSNARKHYLKTRLPLIIGAIPFLLAGLDALGQGDIFFGVANLLMAAINLAALIFVEKLPVMTNLVLFLLNAVMAFIIAYQYKIAGKIGLPYAWVFAGIFYIGAGIVFYRNMTAKKNSSV